jgi:3-oxoacyl-[acyl-carrier-protein] synthase-1
MNSQPLSIVNTGLVTSVGLSSAAACAAIRAGLTNPFQTRFRDLAGNWIMAHGAPLDHPWPGRIKLTKMASMALGECLAPLPRESWPDVPLLLCLAEPGRPGRFDGPDSELFEDIQNELQTGFSRDSAIISHGRASVATALVHARELIADHGAHHVAILATDSLLNWPTLQAYDAARRLLTEENSNGFIPGEGSGALLVNAAGNVPSLVCTGIGRAVEAATIEKEEPLRADGMTQAIRAALSEAGCHFHDLDFRVTDLSGEQYYFKEAGLAVGRILRVRMEEFDLWHPAECIGEAGATAGLAAIIVANAACRGAYAPGPRVLCHFSCDGGARAAVVLEYRSQ